MKLIRVSPNETVNQNSPLISHDMTTNFHDLGLWSSEVDLRGKTIKEVLLRIRVVIDEHPLKSRFLDRMYQREAPTYAIANWEFGFLPGKYGKDGDQALLPKEDRIEILVYHLNGVYEELKKQPEDWKCWLCDW
jgi:hypothetical protein